jgi:hypothetical protein
MFSARWTFANSHRYWHMGLLRTILLVVAALLWALIAYVVIDSSIIHPHKEAIFDYVMVYGILIYLVYVLRLHF